VKEKGFCADARAVKKLAAARREYCILTSNVLFSLEI
jgi:hypothetical protein